MSLRVISCVIHVHVRTHSTCVPAPKCRWYMHICCSCVERISVFWLENILKWICKSLCKSNLDYSKSPCTCPYVLKNYAAHLVGTTQKNLKRIQYLAVCLLPERCYAFVLQMTLTGLAGWLILPVESSSGVLLGPRNQFSLSGSQSSSICIFWSC